MFWSSQVVDKLVIQINRKLVEQRLSLESHAKINPFSD